MPRLNTYLNGDVQLARERGYDIVQLKLDGWNCRAYATAGQFHYFSETEREFATSDGFGLDGCVLHGEFMRGTQWSQDPSRKGIFFVFDISAVHGEPLSDESYSTRYRLLRKLTLPPTFRLVQCFPIGEFDAVWNRFVLRDGFEGVVFRRTTSGLDDAIIRQKREYTLDGTVVGFEPGLGRNVGRLGAVRVCVGENSVTSVGGGFSDDEREFIWANQARFLGRVMEFTANAIFESGNVRHPRFVKWRDDRVSGAFVERLEAAPPRPESSPDS